MKKSFKLFVLSGALGLILSSAFFVSHHSNSIINKAEAASETSADWNKPYTGQYAGTYYSGITAKEGSNLQNQLTTLLANGAVKVSYNGLFDVYKDSDSRPEDGTIFDMYADYHFPHSKNSGTYHGVGDLFNREHSIPKSWWGGTSDERYSDAHHLLPTDGYVNNRRSAYALGEVGNTTYSYTFKNDIVGVSKLGSSSFSGYNGTVFEPADCFKGDFARIYFYFATRYRNKLATSSNGATHFSTSGTCGLTTYSVNLFLKWHRNDPVSIKEVNRNEGVYKWQKNRNPFVDHPEYVEAIWGDTPVSENKVTLSASTLSLPVNSSGITISATSSDSSQISWKSDNTSIVTVSSSSAASGANITILPVAAGSTTVTASATIDGTKYNASCAVTVTKTLQSLSVSGTPTQTTYAAGDKFNSAGLTVTATYSDSSQENVTSKVTWTPDPLTAGTTSVTGTYSGKSVVVNGITVTAVESCTLTPANFATSYPSSETSLSNTSFDIKAKNAANYSSKIQFKKNSDKNDGGYIYNSAAQSLSQITISGVSGSLTVYAGNSAHPTTNAITGSSNTYDVSDYSYFTIANVSSNVATAASINITLSGGERTLTGISLTNIVDDYYVGDEFVKPTVTATYDNGTSKDATASATFTGYNMNAAGNYTVNVSYTEKTVTKTTSFGITVNALPTVTSLSASGAPSKTTYFEGELFVSAGLEITAYYSDSTEEDVTDDVTWTPSPLTYGTTSVTANYEGKSVVVNGITVNHVELTSISTKNQTTAYYVGGTYSYDGVCTAHYNNNTQETVTPTVDDSAVNMAVAGTYEVTLSYTKNGITKSTSFEITVAAEKSSLQKAYEAAAALADKAESSDTYTFSGTITGSVSNSFYVQDGNYSMYVYSKTNYINPETDIGKHVTVTAKVKKYNGILETGTISNVVVGTASETITPKEVTSYDTIASLNQSILSNLSSGVVKTKTSKGSTTSPISDWKVTITIGGQDIEVFASKYIDTLSTLNSFYDNISVGDYISISNMVTSYNSGNMQLALTEQSVLTKGYSLNSFCLEFLNNLLCDETGTFEPTYTTGSSWSSLAGLFDKLSSADQTTLRTAEADENGTVIEQCAARYDYIVAKYGYTNFINRVMKNNLNVITQHNNNYVGVVLVVSIVSITSLLGLAILFKKKKTK